MRDAARVDDLDLAAGGDLRDRHRAAARGSPARRRTRPCTRGSASRTSPCEPKRLDARTAQSVVRRHSVALCDAFQEAKGLQYGARVDATAAPGVMIVPANEATWEDIQAVFGTRGDPSRCQCQRYKMQHRGVLGLRGRRGGLPAPGADRLRSPRGHDSGLVAYLDGEPVGWCAVEPRTAYPRLLLKTRVPWEGRAEDKSRRGCLGRDLLRHPHGLPAPRRQPSAGPRRRRLRASAAPAPSRATR